MSVLGSAVEFEEVMLTSTPSSHSPQLRTHGSEQYWVSSSSAADTLATFWARG